MDIPWGDMNKGWTVYRPDEIAAKPRKEKKESNKPKTARKRKLKPSNPAQLQAAYGDPNSGKTSDVLKGLRKSLWEAVLKSQSLQEFDQNVLAFAQNEAGVMNELPEWRSPQNAFYDPNYETFPPEPQHVLQAVWEDETFGPMLDEKQQELRLLSFDAQYKALPGYKEPEEVPKAKKKRAPKSTQASQKPKKVRIAEPEQEEAAPKPKKQKKAKIPITEDPKFIKASWDQMFRDWADSKGIKPTKQARQLYEEYLERNAPAPGWRSESKPGYVKEDDPDYNPEWDPKIQSKDLSELDKAFEKAMEKAKKEILQPRFDASAGVLDKLVAAAVSALMLLTRTEFDYGKTGEYSTLLEAQASVNNQLEVARSQAEGKEEEESSDEEGTDEDEEEEEEEQEEKKPTGFDAYTLKYNPKQASYKIPSEED